jgi:hypothetical protein
VFEPLASPIADVGLGCGAGLELELKLGLMLELVLELVLFGGVGAAGAVFVGV